MHFRIKNGSEGLNIPIFGLCPEKQYLYMRGFIYGDFYMEISIWRKANSTLGFHSTTDRSNPGPHQIYRRISGYVQFEVDETLFSVREIKSKLLIFFHIIQVYFSIFVNMAANKQTKLPRTCFWIPAKTTTMLIYLFSLGRNLLRPPTLVLCFELRCAQHTFGGLLGRTVRSPDTKFAL